MKTNTLLLTLSVLTAFSVSIMAQGLPGIDQNSPLKQQHAVPGQKGKFNIALQDFSFGAVSNNFTLAGLGVRAGYSITNKDMVFLSGQFTWNPRDGYAKAIETALFYRRYFREGAFQPFMQFGGGLGYVEFNENEMNFNPNKFYGTLSGGTGVSFRYKRWGFEMGIQSDFNRYSTGRFSIRPIAGISFSF